MIVNMGVTVRIVTELHPAACLCPRCASFTGWEGAQPSTLLYTSLAESEKPPAGWKRPSRSFLAAFVVAILLAAPARADCTCSVPRVEVDGVPRCPPGATVQCDVETFGRTVDALLQAEHDRDVARAANVRMEEELRVRITPDSTPVWPWAAGGLVLGLVVGVVLAR